MARLVAEQGLVCLRRSAADRAGEPADGALPEILLLDSLGELASLYAASDIAFIGGTLVPTGGHNPLEPAAFGIPTIVGPSMENFADMARRFEDAEAWRTVRDASGLATVWREWSGLPETARAIGDRARHLLLENRGALDRTLEMLAPLLRRTQDRKIESAEP